MTHLRVARDGAVGRITLARPEKKNALDQETAVELTAALRQHENDDAIRVVLLNAEGEDFCAGADLEALARMLDSSAEAHQRDAELLGEVFTTMRALAKPVVGAVQGRALAGGLGLVTACDIAVAHENARFGYPEVRVGFVPAMVMTLLRRATGEKRAFELVATGRQFSAAEALELGIVSRVASAAQFTQAVATLIEELARAAPAALARTKRLFYQLDGLPFEKGIALGAAQNAEARMTDDFRSGVQRFVRRDSGGQR